MFTGTADVNVVELTNKFNSLESPSRIINSSKKRVQEDTPTQKHRLSQNLKTDAAVCAGNTSTLNQRLQDPVIPVVKHIDSELQTFVNIEMIVTN